MLGPAISFLRLGSSVDPITFYAGQNQIYIQHC